MKSNCSKSSRAGDGNTASSPALHWLLTIDKKTITSDELCNLFQKIGVSYQFQGERGQETQYEHWQAYIHLEKKQRLTFWKKILPTAHAEKCNNIQASINYCSKSETAITPVYKWNKPKYNVKTITDDQLYNWQRDILKIINEPADDRTVHWYWSEKGKTGKTQFCKYLVVKYDALYIGNGKSNDIKYAVSESKTSNIILLDFSRCTKPEMIPYEAIEDIKNGIFFSGKYESKTTVRDSPHMLIFANMEPMTHLLSEDRWHIVNID